MKMNSGLIVNPPIFVNDDSSFLKKRQTVSLDNYLFVRENELSIFPVKTVSQQEFMKAYTSLIMMVSPYFTSHHPLNKMRELEEKSEKEHFSENSYLLGYFWRRGIKEVIEYSFTKASEDTFQNILYKVFSLSPILEKILKIDSSFKDNLTIYHHYKNDIETFAILGRPFNKYEKEIGKVNSCSGAFVQMAASDAVFLD